VATLASITALLTVVLNTFAAALGAWRWWRVETSRAFWVAARVGQGAAVALAAVAGVAYASGARPDDGLFWLYAILPLAVAFIAEQFRILSAQTVLEQRGLENARAVGTLPADQQRSVVTQILRRELGVVALAAAVIAFLALRAASEVSGL
jgi:hypothetical protein